MSDHRPIQSVATALRLIETMASAARPLGVTELAQAVDMTKPRVYRHLRTMVEFGYVEQDPGTEKYAPTLKLYEIGLAIADRVEFLSEARRLLPALRDRVHLTTTAGRLESEGVRILDMLRSATDIEITSRPGTLFGFHHSAHGRAALAFGPAGLLDSLRGKALESVTAKTTVDLAELERKVEEARRRGWASAPEETLPGINAVAAPVFDASGALAGTIAITGSVKHLPVEPLPEQLDALMQTAQEISRRLGYRGKWK